MKRLNRTGNPLCTSIENLIVILSKFPSDACTHVELISLPRLKKVVFKVIDRAQRTLQGATGKSLAEPSNKNFLL